MDRGTVEHLDIEKVVMDNFGDLNIIHKERKNMGMTYIYIIENTPKKTENESDDSPDSQQIAATNEQNQKKS